MHTMKNTHHKSNIALEKCDGIRACAGWAIFAIAICLIWTAVPAAAQTAGEGSIQGTVMDSTGAVVPHATVTITNAATGVKTVQYSSSAGFFNIAPVLPGTYSVQVAAKGFKTLLQDNVVVDALQVRTVSPVLSVGTETQTVTVTGAPPVLDTADATIGHDCGELNLFEPAGPDEQCAARSHGFRHSDAGRAECQQRRSPAHRWRNGKLSRSTLLWMACRLRP